MPNTPTAPDLRSVLITTNASTAGAALDQSRQLILQNANLTSTQKLAGTTQIENVRTELVAAINYGETLYKRGVIGVDNITSGIDVYYSSAVSTIAGYIVGRNTSIDTQQYNVNYVINPTPVVTNTSYNQYNGSVSTPSYSNLPQAADGGSSAGGQIGGGGVASSNPYASTYTGQTVPNDSPITDWNTVTVAADFSGVVSMPIGYGFSLAPESQGGGVTFTIAIPTTANSSSSNLIINGTLPDGAAGQLYKTTSLSVSGGTSPYTFSANSGALPTGLALSTGGVVSGTIDIGSTIGTYTFTLSAIDSNSLVGTRTYSINVVAALQPSTTPQTPPTFHTPTPANKNFKFVRGISYIQPDVPSYATSLSGVLSAQYVGAEFVAVSGQAIIVNVHDINNTPIPVGTTVILNSQDGTPLLSAYSGTNEVSVINLYYTPLIEPAVYTVTVQTDHNGRGWIPVTTLSATGTGRIVQGSNRAAVWGPTAGNYPLGFGSGLFAGGCTDNAYIRSIDIKGGNDYSVETGDYYTFRAGLQGYQNPFYGVLASAMPVDPITEAREIGFSSISPKASALPIGNTILNTIIEFTVVDPLKQAATKLELYTPHTFAVTNQPLWLQTAIPYGYAKYRINWGDGTIRVLDNLTTTQVFYSTHSYTAASDTPYTVSVSALDSSNNLLQSAVLSSQFYVQDTFPELSLADYSKTLSNNSALPNSLSNVKIGSNEWVTADNINAAFSKLETNFQYLNTVTKYIKKSPNLELIEWLGDFVQYPTWNTLLSGSNTFTQSNSSNYIGVTPGDIVDFKSYKSPFAAPDYYNYVIFTSPGSNSSIQIRKNDYLNTKVLTLSSVVPGAQNFNAYSLDVSATNLFVLGQDAQSNKSTTLYKFNLDYNNGTSTIVNKIGGYPGNRADHYAFGQNSTQHANDVKVYNNKVYVADNINSCIKVYNSSLTWQATIFNSLLSGLNLQLFDINQSNGDIFVLGLLKAPNAPVITSVTSQASGTNTQYSVTWNHDGNRLIDYDYITKNFRIYGQVEGSDNYTLIDTVYSDLGNFSKLPKLTKYIFLSSKKYINFSIQAIGKYGIDSALSQSTIVPNKDSFPTPWAIFVFNQNTALNKILTITEVPPTANIVKILVEPTGVFFYVVTDTNIYKYTTTGLYVNRISNPSSATLSEPLVTAFIDERYYFYLATSSRVFKFIDIPVVDSLFNYDVASSYYTPLSSYSIGENELVQDWIYNKAINQIVNNHEIIAKSIKEKYVTTIDRNSNLVNFEARALSSTEIIQSLSATESNYVHSNEIVSSAVVNRALERVYNIQETVLEAVLPEVVIQPPLFTENVLGEVTATLPNVIYQYIQPPLVFTSPVGNVQETLTAGASALFAVTVQSASADANIAYQWYFNDIAITGATTRTYFLSSTALTDIGVYYCVAADNIEPVKSPLFGLGVNLDTHFAFASAQFIGNLYSSIHSSATTRYGNDYVATVGVINVPLTGNLLISYNETNGNDPGVFASPVYITVTKDSTVIYSAVTSVSATVAIQLSSYLTTDSASVGTDGYPDTYAGKFNIKLSVGDSSSNVIVPRITVKPSQGAMYSASFTNSLFVDTFDSTSTTIYGTSGSMPYAAITNNSLGGYLKTNPYLVHNWTVDGVKNGNTSVLYKTPADSKSSTLSATRTTTGETEVTLTYDRVVGTAPTVPYYNINAYTGVKAKGNGYTLGGGNYKAGSLIQVRYVGTYLAGGGVAPGRGSSTPLQISGPGIWDTGVYVADGGKINMREDPESHSVSLMDIYVDGNKTIIGYFYA